jgi:hypothetical protein
VTTNGDLVYEGSIVDYNLSPIAAQGNETASLTRLSITVRIKYTNQMEKELNFEKNFTKYADFPAGQDLFSVQEELWNNINDQLIQEIYNFFLLFGFFIISIDFAKSSLVCFMVFRIFLY